MTLTTKVTGADAVVDRFTALDGSTAVSKLDVLSRLRTQLYSAPTECRSYMERRYLIPAA